MNDSFSCIIVDDEPLAIELLTTQLSHIFRNIRVLACCTDWEDAINAIRIHNPDLLFMDISMPGKNGIDLLKLLPAISSEIIFITAHEEYAIEAFNFTVSGYLLKPVSDSDLSQAVNRAIGRARHKRASALSDNSNVNINDKIGIPNKNGIDYVNIHDILYLESVNKCTKIVTASNEYTSFSPLVKFKVITESHPFIQVHRSFIINLNYILRYQSSGLVTMSNKYDIPVARTFKNDLLARFNKTF